MTQNSLLQDNFIQLKHREYEIGDYYNRYNNQFGTTITKIKALNPAIYTPFSISLESTIQRLAAEQLPSMNDKVAKDELCLQLTKDYGFLYFPRHIQSINDDIELNQYTSLFKGTDSEFIAENTYQPEPAEKWWRFITTLQYLMKRIEDINFNESQRPDDMYFNDTQVELYLNEIKPSYDFNTQSISLKCDSLASACILSIVSNKKHLKSCKQCSKLFFAGRSDAMYCNSNCGRNNQGSRRGKSKEL